MLLICFICLHSTKQSKELRLTALLKVTVLKDLQADVAEKKASLWQVWAPTCRGSHSCTDTWFSTTEVLLGLSLLGFCHKPFIYFAWPHWLFPEPARSLSEPSQKTREVMGLQKQKLPSPQGPQADLGWCHLRHQFWSWARDHTWEHFWTSQRPGICVCRVGSSCGIWTTLHSAHQRFPHVCHTF